MNGFAKALVMSCALLFTVALLPFVAFADDGNASNSQLSTASAVAADQADGALQAGTFDGTVVTHSTHVALIQEGAVPSAAEAGTPWDGMKTENDNGAAKSDDSGLSSQAINPVDTAKSRILKALLEVRQGDIDLSDCGIPSNDISGIYASVINSSPDLFYVSGSMSWSSQYTNDGTFIVTSITPFYNHDIATIKNQMKPAYNNAFRELLSWVPEGAGPIEKAKAVHDWLVRNCAYNTDAANNFTIKKAGKNSAKVATTSITKKFKASKRTRKLSATKTVTLPKVTTKFGKAKWKIVTKDPRGVLTLKSGKVKVKKGAKRRTYKIELKATVKGTSSYKGASTKVVTVRVKVR